MKSGTKIYSRWGAVFGTLIFVIAAAIMFMFMRTIGTEPLQAMVYDAGIFAPLVYILIKIISNVLAPTSAGPIQLSSGVLFGLWRGTLYSLIGEVVGGTLNFLIARHFGHPLVQRFVGKQGMQRVDELYQTLGGWRALLKMRLYLFAVYDFVSYAAGLTSMRFREYVIISIVAGFVPTFISVALGAFLAGGVGWLPIYESVVLFIFTVLLLLHPYFRERQAISEKKHEI